MIFDFGMFGASISALASKHEKFTNFHSQFCINKKLVHYASKKLKPIFYKVDVEKLNRKFAEFCKFEVYLIFHIKLKKNGV